MHTSGSRPISSSVVAILHAECQYTCSHRMPSVTTLGGWSCAEWCTRFEVAAVLPVILLTNLCTVFTLQIKKKQPKHEDMCVKRHFQSPLLDTLCCRVNAQLRRAGRAMPLFYRMLAFRMAFWSGHLCCGRVALIIVLSVMCRYKFYDAPQPHWN